MKTLDVGKKYQKINSMWPLKALISEILVKNYIFDNILVLEGP